MKFNIKNKKDNFFLFFCSLCFVFCIFFAGCAQTKYNFNYRGSGQSFVPQRGIYHEVKEGQTLWRICREYGVSLEDITEINNIKRYSLLKKGQLLFIPNVDNKIDVSVYKRNIKAKQVKTETVFIYPVHGSVKSKFGQKENGIKNKGLNFSVGKKSVVRSSKTGFITYVDENMRGLGKMVMVDHQDGYITVYSKFSDIVVEEGSVIGQGDKIGYTDTMLYFEIRKDARPVDPLLFLSK